MAHDKQKEQPPKETKTKKRKPRASTPAQKRRPSYSSPSFAAANAPSKPTSTPPAEPATSSPFPDHTSVSSQPPVIQKSLYRGSIMRYADKHLPEKSGKLSGPPLQRYLDDVGAYAKGIGLADSVVQDLVKEAKNFAVGAPSKVAPQKGKGENNGSEKKIKKKEEEMAKPAAGDATGSANPVYTKSEPTRAVAQSSAGHNDESEKKSKRKERKKRKSETRANASTGDNKPNSAPLSAVLQGKGGAPEASVKASGPSKNHLRKRKRESFDDANVEKKHDDKALSIARPSEPAHRTVNSATFAQGNVAKRTGAKAQFSKDSQSTSPPRKKAKRDDGGKVEQKRAQEALEKVGQQAQLKQAGKLEGSKPAEGQTGKRKKNRPRKKKPGSIAEDYTPSASRQSPSVQRPPSREKQGSFSSGSQATPLKRKRSLSVSNNGKSGKSTTAKLHPLPTIARAPLIRPTPVDGSRRQRRNSEAEKRLKVEERQHIAEKRLSDAGRGSSVVPSSSLAKSRSEPINEEDNIMARRSKSKSLESALSKETKEESSSQEELGDKKPNKKKKKLEAKARKQKQRDDFSGALPHRTPKPVKDWQPLERDSTPLQPEPVGVPALDAGVKRKGYQALDLDATPPQSDLEDDSTSDVEIPEQNREASPESEAEESDQASDSEPNEDSEQEDTGKVGDTSRASQTIAPTPRKMGTMAGMSDLMEYTTSLIRGLAPPPLPEPVVQKQPVVQAPEESESESEASESSEQSDDSEKPQPPKPGYRVQSISKPHQDKTVPSLLGQHTVQKPTGLVTEANEDSDSEDSESSGDSDSEDSELPEQAEKPLPSKAKSPVSSEKQMNQSAHALPLLGQHVVQKSNEPDVATQGESESEQSEVSNPSLSGHHGVQQPIEPRAAAQDKSRSEAESSVTSKPQSPSESEPASDPAGANVAHEQDSDQDADSGSDLDVQRDEKTPSPGVLAEDEEETEKHEPEPPLLARELAPEDPVESTEKSPDPAQIHPPESGSVSGQHSIEQTSARTPAERPGAKKAKSRSTVHASPHDINNSARRGSGDSTGSQRVLRSMDVNKSPISHATGSTQRMAANPKTKVGRFVCVRIHAKPKTSEDEKGAIESDQNDGDEEDSVGDGDGDNSSADEGSEGDGQSEKKDAPEKEDQVTEDEGTDVDEKTPERPVFTVSFSQNTGPTAAGQDDDNEGSEHSNGQSDKNDTSDDEDQIADDDGMDVDEKMPERPVFTVSFSQNTGPTVVGEDGDDETKSAFSNPDDVSNEKETEDEQVPAAAGTTAAEINAAPQDVMGISSDRPSSEADSDEESNTRQRLTQPSAEARATQASPRRAKTPRSHNGKFMITTGSPIIETSKKMTRTRLSRANVQSAKSVQATPRSRRGTSEEFPWIDSSARSSRRKTKAPAANHLSQVDGSGSAPLPSTPPSVSEVRSRASSYENEPKGFLRPDGSLSAQRRSTGLRSQHFTPPSASQKLKRPPAGTVSCLPFPSIKAVRFGLIQEELANDPFGLLIAVIFLNKTKGTVAIPKFREFIARYPTPDDLAHANLLDITKLLRPLGMQNSRANILIEMAKCWLLDCPQVGRRYRTVNYPTKGAQRDIKPSEILDDTDPRVAAFEIGHLPGCGPYALDSWRIFCRDALRGVALDWNGAGVGDAGFEPEWKRVRPNDKELRAFLRWMWLRDGWEWDPETGEKKLAEAGEAKVVAKRWRWDQEKGEEVWVDEEDVGEASEDDADKNAHEALNSDVDMTDADADAPEAGLSSPHGKNGPASPAFRGTVEDDSSETSYDRHEDDDSAALQLTQEAARASQQPLLVDSPRTELRKLWPPPSSQPEPSSSPEQPPHMLNTTQSSQVANVDENEEVGINDASTERNTSTDVTDDEVATRDTVGASPYGSLQGVVDMFKSAERTAEWFFRGVVDETPQPESPAKKRAREAREAASAAETELGRTASSSPIEFREEENDDDQDVDMEGGEATAGAAARQASPEL